MLVSVTGQRETCWYLSQDRVRHAGICHRTVSGMLVSVTGQRETCWYLSQDRVTHAGICHRTV